MAQLTDDCFAFGGRLIPLDEALAAARPQFQKTLKPEWISLSDALGRTTAQKVMAPRSVPPHPNSAVDGYAVRHADLAKDGSTALPLNGYAAAGDQPSELPPGSCRRILTGAAMPFGADTVFMDEDVVVNGSTVELPKGLKLGANAREAGEDIRKGDVVLEAGIRLKAAHLGILSSLGFETVQVGPQIRVALFSTGNEIKDPGDDLAPGQVYDANRFALRGLLEQAGVAVLDLGILPDTQEAIDKALTKAAPTVDLILTSGGVSAGDHDVVRAVLEDRGELLFWRLAVKPGRPLALGRFKDRPVIGLPGNPAAAMMMFYVAALPLIQALQGQDEKPALSVEAVLDFRHKKKADRIEFVRVQVSQSADGRLHAQKFPREGAGLLSSIAWADGFIALEPDRLLVEPGETGRFTAFDWTFAP